MIASSLRKQIWIVAFAGIILGMVVPLDSNAMGRGGFLSRLGSNEGGGLFSCLNKSDADAEETSEVVTLSEESSETEIDSDSDTRREGFFARLRSKRTGKKMTTDAQDMTENSSSDLPAEVIPPAPKS